MALCRTTFLHIVVGQIQMSTRLFEFAEKETEMFLKTGIKNHVLGFMELFILSFYGILFCFKVE